MRKRMGYIAIALALAVLTCNARAAEKDSGPYLGLSLGQGTYRNACVGISVGCSESSIAGTGYVGYRFFSYLAAETGFTYFGRASLDVGSLNIETKGWGIPLYAVGILPLADDKVWLMAKVGGAYWDLKTTASFVATDISISDNGFAFATAAAFNTTSAPTLAHGLNTRCFTTSAIAIPRARVTFTCGPWAWCGDSESASASGRYAEPFQPRRPPHDFRIE